MRPTEGSQRSHLFHASIIFMFHSSYMEVEFDYGANFAHMEPVASLCGCSSLAFSLLECILRLCCACQSVWLSICLYLPYQPTDMYDVLAWIWHNNNDVWYHDIGSSSVSLLSLLPPILPHLMSLTSHHILIRSGWSLYVLSPLS